MAGRRAAPRPANHDLQPPSPAVGPLARRAGHQDPLRDGRGGPRARLRRDARADRRHAPRPRPLATLPPAKRRLADAAGDSDTPRGFLLARGAEPVVPNNPTRKRLHPFDKPAHPARNFIEPAIGRLKDGRRVHTGYDKLARHHVSAVAIAAPVIGSR
jgi:putative transposase